MNVFFINSSSYYEVDEMLSPYYMHCESNVTTYSGFSFVCIVATIK